MANIRISKEDQKNMRDLYLQQLQETLAKLDHIKSVLESLGGEEAGVPSISVEVKGGFQAPETLTAAPAASGAKPKAAGKRGRKPGPKPKKKADSGTKPGRKSTWEPKIQDVLEKFKRPMTYDDLTEEIMQADSIAEDKRNNTKQALQSVIFRVRKQGGEFQTLNLGGREKHIVLTDWLNTSGNLKPEYKLNEA